LQELVWGLDVIRFISLILLGLACSNVAHAAPTDAIFVCVDSDGHKTYQNSADNNSCRRIEGIVTTLPSSDLPRSRQLARANVARAEISQASFPRVDTRTQKLRDSDRRRILEDELRAEEDHLNRLRGDFNRGQPKPNADEMVGTAGYRDRVQHMFEDIERTEGNIASLRRELTPVRF
jgi:hypothetical protein